MLGHILTAARARRLVPWCLLALAACGDASALTDDVGTAPATLRMNIPVVDQGHAGQPTYASQAPASAAGAAQVPAQTCGAPAGATPGTDAQRDTVRTYIRRLMDETRYVPDTAARKGGPRGSPGSFAKLSSAQVEEFVTAIIKGAQFFLPKSLTDEQRWGLVAAEISIESAFVPGTRGVNPGDPTKVSVSPLQITVRSTPQGPGMWEDIFVQYAQIPGLTHLDGSPWDPKSTTADELEHSIHDGIIASLWCITEQGRRGCPDWMGGPDGPCPKTMRNAYLAWVVGGPAVRTYQTNPTSPEADLAGQRDAYIASIETDLKLLGFDPSLVDTTF